MVITGPNLNGGEAVAVVVLVSISVIVVVDAVMVFVFGIVPVLLGNKDLASGLSFVGIS